MSPDSPLDRLVAEQTRPDAGDEERAVHRLILAAATDPEQRLTEEEIARIVRHIAGAGFDPNARERARGTIVNRPRPGGGIVQTGERLPPAEIHFLRHCIVQEERPPGTTLPDYLADCVAIVRDPRSRLFASRYQGVWQCGAIGPNPVPRGPRGHEWIIVDYRLMLGFWTTAYQWEYGPDGLADPHLDRRREAMR
jgi:hypothetical protein